MNDAASPPELQPAASARTPAYLCPPDLLLRARRLGPLPVAVAGAGAAHVLQSLAWAVGFGLVEPLLVGNPEAIAANLPEELAGARVVPAGDEADAAAKAVALVKGGEAALLMKGHLHTDTLLRAALAAGTGLRAGNRLSHVFAMYWAGRRQPLLITDAALNVAPDARTFTAILRHALLAAQALDISQPRIAMLSASEEASQAVPSSLIAAEVASAFQEEARTQGAYISGPMALDVAVSANAAEIKGLKADPVAGRADILAVPNIETGNALFKMLVHVVNATAAGVVLGAAVPIILTSRADPAEARLASVALARLIAARHG